MSDSTATTAAPKVDESHDKAEGGHARRSVKNEVVRHDPVEERGTTVIADTVVAKVAGIATREISGVYDLGGTGERMVGKVREVIPGTATNITQGISVEVGQKQAAVDVQIIAEYGVAIHQLAAAIRRNVVSAIEGMTGLEVTEVNVTVHDVHLPGSDDSAPPAEPDQPSRVQ